MTEKQNIVRITVERIEPDSRLWNKTEEDKRIFEEPSDKATALSAYKGGIGDDPDSPFGVFLWVDKSGSVTLPVGAVVKVNGHPAYLNGFSQSKLD